MDLQVSLVRKQTVLRGDQWALLQLWSGFLEKLCTWSYPWPIGSSVYVLLETSQDSYQQSYFFFFLIREILCVCVCVSK